MRQSQNFQFLRRMSVLANDYIRWNGTFRNTNVAPSPIVIQQTRDSPLLYNPKEYEVSVESFAIDTEESPIFTALVNQGSASSINELNYYVQFLWSGTTSTRFLMMQSAYPQYAPPSINTNNSVNYQPYYSVMDSAVFVSMVNTALAACYTTLQAQVGYPTADVSPPYVTMDPASGILALVVPQTMITNGVDIVFENDLMDKLNLPFTTIIENNPGFPLPNIAHKIASTSWTAFGYVTTSAFPATMATTPYWAFPARAIVTDHDYRAGWFDVFRILVVSNMACPESTSFSQDSTSSQNGSQNILASYTLDLTGSDHVNGQLLYSPFFYKWVSIQPSDAIQMINIQFMYQTKTGKTFPLLQTFGRTTDIKLVFKRKTSALPEPIKLLKKRKLGE